QRFDGKTVAVLVTVAVCLTVQNYFSHPAAVGPVFAALGWVESAEQLQEWNRDQNARLAWWAGTAVLTYLVVPALVIRVGFRERLTDYGLKLRGLFTGGLIYVGFVGVMVPLVVVCSAESWFQQTYPFYRVHTPAEVNAAFVRWELLYALQFLALEFFFRGFVVHGTKHRFGAYSVVVMTVPYCMIHFGKPLPECVASIVAGLALGVMSLVTRSVWLGAALHVSVAWGMDVACLWRRGLLT
ncbi:MAG: CPBP family glutamic-type intramembrane protease, partial [Fimbriiglobus sp.]